VATADVGTNADSVPTLSSTSTFTNKTLTSPTITTANLSGAQLLAEGASIQLDPTLQQTVLIRVSQLLEQREQHLHLVTFFIYAADSRWELVDADSTTTCGAVLTGMCVLASGRRISNNNSSTRKYSRRRKFPSTHSWGKCLRQHNPR